MSVHDYWRLFCRTMLRSLGLAIVAWGGYLVSVVVRDVRDSITYKYGWLKTLADLGFGIIYLVPYFLLGGWWIKKEIASYKSMRPS